VTHTVAFLFILGACLAACAEFSDAADIPCSDEPGMVQDHATCLPEKFAAPRPHVAPTDAGKGAR
jgi:hypothetical protein